MRRRDRGLLVVFALLALGGVPFAPPSKRGRMTLAQLRSLAAHVGFPDPVTAAAIAMAESNGDPTTANVVTQPAPGNLPERSFGLWQINTLAHPEFNEAQLLDPAYNAQAALAISKGGTDWTQWTMFTNGRYKQFLMGG
jgi:hypothetical protein